jgi:hypothetical protein
LRASSTPEFILIITALPHQLKLKFCFLNLLISSPLQVIRLEPVTVVNFSHISLLRVSLAGC